MLPADRLTWSLARPGDWLPAASPIWLLCCSWAQTSCCVSVCLSLWLHRRQPSKLRGVRLFARCWKLERLPGWCEERPPYSFASGGVCVCALAIDISLSSQRDLLLLLLHRYQYHYYPTTLPSPVQFTPHTRLKSKTGGLINIFNTLLLPSSFSCTSPLGSGKREPGRANWADICKGGPPPTLSWRRFTSRCIMP